MNAEQLKRETIAALDKLPQLQLDAVMMTCCCGLLEREAAQLLGITRHRLRTTLAAAYKTLKAQFKPEPVSRIFDATDSEIRAALNKLPELERRAIELLYYDCQHERDAAKQLGVTRNKLRMVFNTGLHRLKVEFDVVP